MNWLFFFRAFFPSWVFFTQANSEISLQVRYQQGAEVGSWEDLTPQIQRRAGNLFWNPTNNFLHACHNSLHHLLTDVNDLEDTSEEKIESLASYKVVKNMVAFLLQSKGVSLKAYQFRLVVRDPSFLSGKSQTFLISPQYGSEQ